MIIKKLSANIHIHEVTYVVAFFSFLAGYFEAMFLLILSIIIHEFGHLLAILIFNKKNPKITIYPFGGITTYDDILNSSIVKELVILIMGPLMQVIFMLLITLLSNYIPESTFILLMKINIALLTFNLLPILPLDGGKILNIVLDLILPYKYSHVLTIIVSTLFIVFSIIYFSISFKLFFIIVLLLLIRNLIEEYINHKPKVNKFILERVLYIFNYKQGNDLKSLNNIKRNKKHNFIKNNKIYTEKEYISKYYLKQLQNR